MAFEAVPDHEVTDVDLELCAVRVHSIGRGLPCLGQRNLINHESYGKSDVSRSFDDFGVIDLGDVCPLNYPNGNDADNKFTASLYYRSDLHTIQDFFK